MFLLLSPANVSPNTIKKTLEFSQIKHNSNEGSNPHENHFNNTNHHWNAIPQMTTKITSLSKLKNEQFVQLKKHIKKNEENKTVNFVKGRRNEKEKLNEKLNLHSKLKGNVDKIKEKEDKNNNQNNKFNKNIS